MVNPNEDKVVPPEEFDHFDVPLEDLKLIPADYEKDEVKTDG